MLAYVSCTLTVCAYADVPADSWYVGYVEAARQILGIIDSPPKAPKFRPSDAIKKSEFIKMLLINKGRDTLSNMFVSMWADPDLGGFTDDLVGCDTLLSLGYCYNSTNFDAIYGTAPPSIGYDFFLGPKDIAGRVLPLTSFNKYINGTDPHSSGDPSSSPQV